MSVFQMSAFLRGDRVLPCGLRTPLEACVLKGYAKARHAHTCLLQPDRQWVRRQNFRRAVHQREFNACTPNHCAAVSDRDVPCGLDTALETRVLKGCAKDRHAHLPPSS